MADQSPSSPTGSQPQHSRNPPPSFAQSQTFRSNQNQSTRTPAFPLAEDALPNMFDSHQDDYTSCPPRNSPSNNAWNILQMLQPDNRQMEYDTVLNETRRIDFTRQDCTNFCRSNPQTMSRQRVDQFVRHVDRMLIFAHHNPHSQPEAEALRTLHAHLESQ